jgi:hypothetical protein
MTEDDIRSLLREIKDEPLPADSLARVRLGVAAATVSRRTMWWRLFATVAAVAAAVVLAVVVLRPTQQPVPAASIAVPEAPVAVAPRQEPPRVVKVRASKPRPVRQTPPKVVNEQPDVVVRIETADPDVVILLLGD